MIELAAKAQMKTRLQKLVGFRKLISYWSKHPLAGRELGGTILRFIWFQIASRVSGCALVWPWIENTSLIVSHGQTGATMNIYCGLHEFHDMAFVLHFLRGEDEFLDIGANVGTFSVLAAGVVGSNGVAVEPIERTFLTLKRNLAINNLTSKVKLKQCGVGAAIGRCKFISDQDTMNKVMTDMYIGESVEVPMETIDSLSSAYKPIFWKVDVEGYELQVLEGATSSLSCENLLAVQLEKNDEFISLIMRSKGFELYSYDGLKRELNPCDYKKTSHNWLWIRNVEYVRERCRNAPYRRIGMSLV